MPKQREQPSFAERHGATVLLVAGMTLILSAVGAVFTDHELAATGLAASGLLAVLAAAVLSRMEGPFSFLGMSGNLRSTDPSAMSPEGPSGPIGPPQGDMVTGRAPIATTSRPRRKVDQTRAITSETGSASILPPAASGQWRWRM